MPPQLPRTDIHHEPDAETCTCGCALKRIGEDISEKLDYTPGTFTVERHIRGKWVCDQCETLVQTPVPPHVIDKGIPTAGLLAHTLVSKFGDHLPCIGRSASMRAPVWPSRNRHWARGWASVACVCNRWWTPCKKRF